MNYRIYLFLFLLGGLQLSPVCMHAQRGYIYQQQDEKTPSKDTLESKLTKSVYKEKYRIDVLASLYLDEIVKQGKSVYANKIPAKAQAGLSFYEGVKLAVQKLNDEGYNMEVHYQDIESVGSSIPELLKSTNFQQTDLIIGAVQGEDLAALAKFAQTHHINFISALSPSDAGITNNPYFTLLQPMLQTHMAATSAFVCNKYAGKTIPILTNPTNNLDRTATGYLVKNYGQQLMPVSIAQPDIVKLGPYFDSTVINPVIIAAMHPTDADSIISFLSINFPNYLFDIYGMPSWKFLKSIKKENSYSNMTVNYTSPFHFDGTTGAGGTLVESYKKVFGTSRPSEMVYRGYESLYWFAYLLNKYGTVFNNKVTDNAAALFTKYDIEPAFNNDSAYLFQENKFLYFYHYNNGQMSVDN